MASEIPRHAQPARGSRRRGWHEYGDYRLVHENQILRLLDSGVVTDDTLSFEGQTAGGRLTEVSLQGRVTTATGPILSVEKRYHVRYVRGRAEIRTAEYRYHAFIPGPPVRDLFRYDNCHGGLDTLHRHAFGAGGHERDVADLAHDAMPWLSEVIEEAHRAGIVTSR